MTESLPAGWTEVPLGELAVFSPKHSATLDHDRDVSFVPMSGVNEETGAITTQQTRKLGEVWKGYTHFADGDVLVAKITPCMENGKAAVARGLLNGIGCGSTEFHVLRPTGSILSEYLWYFVRQQSFRNDAAHVMTGAVGQRRVPASYLKSFPVPVPSLAEQRRIVARIEALFARTRRARTDLERIAALSARHRRSMLAREYEGEQAGSPAQQRLVPLADCVRDFTYGTAAKCSHDVDGIPVLRIPNVAAGRISLEDMKFAALPQREHRKLALEVGDILIVRSNGSPELVGRPALVEQPAAGMAFAGYLIRARPRRERVEPAYLLHMLSSPNVRGIVELNARSSSGVHNINAAELAALEVPLPSLDEQKCAVRRIEQAAAHALVWESDAARSLSLLDRLEQSILARAFRGELVPHSLADDLQHPAQAVDPIVPVSPRRGRRAAA